MFGMYYTLDDQGRPQRATFEDYVTWSAENPGQKVLVQNEVGGIYHVSTVFLGSNHSRARNPRRERRTPMVFETMIFRINDGVIDYSGLMQRQYPSRAAALKGHDCMVKIAQRSVETGSVIE